MTPPARPSCRPLCGFTLIELLVVISIIALLIAILLPALRAANVGGDQSLYLDTGLARQQDLNHWGGGEIPDINIPEPGTLAILGLGVCVGLSRRRRRRRR